MEIINPLLIQVSTIVLILYCTYSQMISINELKIHRKGFQWERDVIKIKDRKELFKIKLIPLNIYLKIENI